MKSQLWGTPRACISVAREGMRKEGSQRGGVKRSRATWRCGLARKGAGSESSSSSFCQAGGEDVGNPLPHPSLLLRFLFPLRPQLRHHQLWEAVQAHNQGDVPWVLLQPSGPAWHLVTRKVSTNNPQWGAWWWEPNQSAALGTGVQGWGAVTRARRPALQRPGGAESRSEGMSVIEHLLLH